MQNSLLNRFSDRIPNVVLTNSTPDAYKSNLLAVEVYFDDINFQRIKETEAYKVKTYSLLQQIQLCMCDAAFQTGQFVSDLGGVLGLWLGFSVLTIFEFLELLWDFLALGKFQSHTALIFVS